MKKILLIASAVAAGTFGLVYLLKRRKNQQVLPPMPVKKYRHLTEVFAHSKQHGAAQQ